MSKYIQEVIEIMSSQELFTIKRASGKAFNNLSITEELIIRKYNNGNDDELQLFTAVLSNAIKYGYNKLKSYNTFYNNLNNLRLLSKDDMPKNMLRLLDYTKIDDYLIILINKFIKTFIRYNINLNYDDLYNSLKLIYIKNYKNEKIKIIKEYLKNETN